MLLIFPYFNESYIYSSFISVKKNVIRFFYPLILLLNVVKANSSLVLVFSLVKFHLWRIKRLHILSHLLKIFRIPYRVLLNLLKIRVFGSGAHERSKIQIFKRFLRSFMYYFFTILVLRDQKRSFKELQILLVLSYHCLLNFFVLVVGVVFFWGFFLKTACFHVVVAGTRILIQLLFTKPWNLVIQRSNRWIFYHSVDEVMLHRLPCVVVGRRRHLCFDWRVNLSRHFGQEKINLFFGYLFRIQKLFLWSIRAFLFLKSLALADENLLIFFLLWSEILPFR